MTQKLPTVTPADLGLPTATPLPKRRDWRIGMVGFGGIARHAHAPAYTQAGWKIAAVADPDPRAREAAQRDFAVPTAYEDYHDLIADPNVEVVDLLTQPTLRLPVVEAAAAAGKPIVTEKPIAETLAEAEAMVEAAQRGAIPFAVHQNYRWMPANFLAHHIVQAGLIGRPFFSSITIYGSQDVALADHPFYSTCNAFLTVQWDTHMQDLLRFWTGRDPKRISANKARMHGQKFRDDMLLSVLVDYGDCLTGHILHHELTRSALQGCACRIDGDQGTIEFDFWHDALTIDSAVTGGGPRQLDISQCRFLSSFAGSMGDLLIAVEEGREPQVSGRRNIATLRAVLNEERSASQNGQWV